MTMLKFPSPCGDYGSYHIRLKKEYGEKLIGFPSPCGDYGSYRGIYMCVIAVYEFPSPCGDYGSYRRPFPSHRKRRQIYISVPLRGLWFLSTLLRCKKTYGEKLFPSPCGDYGSHQQEPTRTYTALLFMFPSPCGDYGSYQLGDDEFFYEYDGFPSPCGDYGSYRLPAFRTSSNDWFNFRPLAGIMVLITKSAATVSNVNKIFDMVAILPAERIDLPNVITDAAMLLNAFTTSGPLKAIKFITVKIANVEVSKEFNVCKSLVITVIASLRSVLKPPPELVVKFIKACFRPSTLLAKVSIWIPTCSCVKPYEVKLSLRAWIYVLKSNKAPILFHWNF